MSSATSRFAVVGIGSGVLLLYVVGDVAIGTSVIIGVVVPMVAVSVSLLWMFLVCY